MLVQHGHQQEQEQEHEETKNELLLFLLLLLVTVLVIELLSVIDPLDLRLVPTLLASANHSAFEFQIPLRAFPIVLVPPIT